MNEAKVEIPAKLVPVFAPARGDVRYRIAKGGRGSAKSATFAKMAAVFGMAEPLRFLCAREIQASIKESFYAEVKLAIESESWLSAHYEIGENFIRGKNGTEFLFKGLRHHMSSIKSMAKIDIAIIEEAEDVPEQSWQQLIPTIRNAKSELWIIYNPRREGSPTDLRFGKNLPPGSVSATINWMDNPWFPDVLNQERMNDLRNLDHALYRHIWEGEYLKIGKSLVFPRGVTVREFDRENPTCYQGLDYGFSQDPDAAIRCFIKGNTLFIAYEAGEKEIETDEKSEFIRSRIPEFEKYVTRADSARPETTSYLRRHGLPLLESVEKWSGSVEDGIAFLRSFDEIVVHPECPQTIREFSLYSYKVDRLTGDILPEIVDANNHFIDALRYALTPLIKQKVVGSFKGLATALARSEVKKEKTGRARRPQKPSW